jgi:hypothetical protein
MGTDWYQNSRDDQLHMVKTWNTEFATKGPTWGIPPQHTAELASDAQAAETILDKVKSGERTAADVVQCNMIFKDMETEARFIKKHYLLMPPLTLADFPSFAFALAGRNSYSGSPAHRTADHNRNLPRRPPCTDGPPCAASRHGTAGQPRRLRLCPLSGHYAAGWSYAGTSRRN